MKSLNLFAWFLNLVVIKFYILVNVVLVRTLKGPSQPLLLFLFTCESLAIRFSLEHVKTKEITVRVLKIIKHTFSSTTYCKKFRFRFTMQYP